MPKRKPEPAPLATNEQPHRDCAGTDRRCPGAPGQARAAEADGRCLAAGRPRLVEPGAEPLNMRELSAEEHASVDAIMARIRRRGDPEALLMRYGNALMLAAHGRHREGTLLPQQGRPATCQRRSD
jgi:hypothetical protein